MHNCKWFPQEFEEDLEVTYRATFILKMNKRKPLYFN